MARAVDAEALEKKISEWLGQPGNGDYYSGYDAALCAVQDLIADMPTLTPQNEPLTLEQLRKMDGEPVWLDRGDGFWALVDTDDDCVWLDRGGSLAICELEGNAYRRPPERQEDTR